MSALWQVLTHGGILGLTILAVIATETIAWRRESRTIRILAAQVAPSRVPSEEA